MRMSLTGSSDTAAGMEVSIELQKGKGSHVRGKQTCFGETMEKPERRKDEW